MGNPVETWEIEPASLYRTYYVMQNIVSGMCQLHVYQVCTWNINNALSTWGSSGSVTEIALCSAPGDLRPVIGR
uniref:Fibronectin type-III domain-containing protein n=1 Tax=Steinernema glaseri TaxID=37863 RepID=A0A1I7Z078_9BILA